MNASPNGDEKTVETGVQALWDAVRRTGEVVVLLRKENEEHRARIMQLEQDLSKATDNSRKSELAIKKLKEEAQEMQSRMHVNGDNHELSVRVKELLAKLEAYL